LESRIAVVEEQNRGLRVDHDALDKYVRGVLAGDVATLSRNSGTQAVEIRGLKACQDEHSDQLAVHEKALTTLLSKAEQSGVRWDRLIGFGMAILQAVTTAMVLYLISQMSNGGP
jgi:uncharacterized iron-regulated protein